MAGEAECPTSWGGGERNRIGCACLQNFTFAFAIVFRSMAKDLESLCTDSPRAVQFLMVFFPVLLQEHLKRSAHVVLL